MNGNSYLIDTNIALFLLGGDLNIANVLKGEKIYISFISELELFGYPDIDENEIEKIQQFINNCIVIDINQEIKEYTIELRRKTGLKLPDCIIGATSQYLKIPLISADKDFQKISEISLIFYENK